MADRRSDRESSDPAVIRSIAVTVDDVVTTLEANASADREAVLRVTPPFSGRMRARIHVATIGGDYEGEAEPIHLDPATLVAEVPTYPTADETAAEQAANDDDIEARRQRHTERVEAWRETVRNRLRERISVDHSTGTLEVQLHALS
ncbi:MAG: hypothetical protein U9O06_00320 [Euryarchaeota archaeon]|nr:hypothetical protein [Euryarchaeota archaeon]